MTALNNQRLWLKCVIFLVFSFLAPLLLYSPEYGIPVNISNNALNYDNLPVIAVDQDNHVHIAWESYYYLPGAPDDTASDLFYTNNIGGSFAPPIQISVPTGWYSQYPSMAFDSQGNVHIAFWRRADQIACHPLDDIYYVTNAGGSFDNPILLVDGGMGSTVNTVRRPSIQCDSQDNLHLFFLGYLWSDTSGDILLLYTNNVSGDWCSYIPAARGTFITEYSACLDAFDHIHIAYTDRVTEPGYFEDNIYYILNVGGVYYGPYMVSCPDHRFEDSPDMAVDSEGNVHIVYEWSDADNEPSIYYVNNISGSFNSWVPVAPDDDLINPNIAVDKTGHVHITYKKSGSKALYYGNNRMGDFDFSYPYIGFNTNELGLSNEYFALGDSSTVHFVVSDWTGVPWESDYETFYLKGTMVLPGEPSNPSPANGAVNVSITPTLEWSTTNADCSDVYFGTASPPPKVATISRWLNSYTPGELGSNTTYYWKIVSKSEGGDTPGPEWHFRTQTKLTVFANQGGTTNPAPGSHGYNQGIVASVTAIPDTGYRFGSWTGDVPSGHENDNPVAITMDSSKSITANFIRQYTLIISAGTGGTTNPSPGSYAHDSGSQVSVRAIPNTGYRFSGWSGDVSGTDNPVAVTMSANKSVTANFSSTSTGDGDTDGGGKGGCFIATAAYGSPLHPCVKVLRNFRDRYLMTHKAGRAFVGLYYKYSPAMAEIIARHKVLKIAVQIYLIPLIIFGYSMIHPGPIITSFILGLIIAIPIFFMKKSNFNTRHFRNSISFL